MPDDFDEPIGSCGSPAPSKAAGLNVLFGIGIVSDLISLTVFLYLKKINKKLRVGFGILALRFAVPQATSAANSKARRR